MTSVEGEWVDPWPTSRMVSSIAGGVVCGLAGTGVILAGAVHGPVAGGAVGSLLTLAGLVAGSMLWRPPALQPVLVRDEPADREAA